MNKWSPCGLALSLCLALPTGAHAKKPGASPRAKVTVASEQTVRAIGELTGNYKWGLTIDDVIKVVSDDIALRNDERIRKESSAFAQDAVRKDMAVQIDKFKNSLVKFDGQKSGWDVSIIDHEFAHKNNEAMLVLAEKQQRRFLFFHDGKLWKQFIAFNAENPAFSGKTFDDFAEQIQKRYGPSSMTFRKMRTTDEQTLDHLEWPPAGDNVLWAIDLTSFYGNFCLSLMQKSKMAEIEKGRLENNPMHSTNNALVDSVMRGNSVEKPDTNADIIDEITGHQSTMTSTGRSKAASASTGGKKKGKNAPEPAAEKEEPKSVDPLEGTNF